MKRGLTKGVCLNQLQKYEEALFCYKKAIKIKTDFHQAWYNKACIYAVQGKELKAIESLKMALRLQPEEDIMLFKNLLETDPDLDFIRDTKSFKLLLLSIKQT